MTQFKQAHIGENSVVYRCVFKDDFTIDNNCIVTYSTFEPRIYIWADCIIDNSIIYKAPPIESTALYSGCVIKNRAFHAIGTYTKELFDTKQFKEFYKLGNYAIVCDTLCRVNCVTKTYDEAYNILTNEDQWQHVINSFSDNPDSFVPRVLKVKPWLLELVNQYKPQ